MYRNIPAHISKPPLLKLRYLLTWSAYLFEIFNKSVFYVIVSLNDKWFLGSLRNYNERSQNSRFARDAREHFQMHSTLTLNSLSWSGLSYKHKIYSETCL